ncbi:hypothetical protein TNCV_3563451 [Trichonephila clavipes]|nr:hypothetical protein TNCV_3563451 [Trichonephila clavipes]
MNCQTKLRINHLTAVKSVAILETAEETVSSTGYLKFSELSSLKRIELHHLGRTPPSHRWYLGRNAGGSFKLMSRKYQTAFQRFVSGLIKALSFRQG